VLSVLTYRGHPGGQDEAASVEHWLGAAAARGLLRETFESPGPLLNLLTTPA